MTSKDAARRHVLGQVKVEEYFDSAEDMAATLAAVRFKIVACFLQATHPVTGKETGRSNYLCGMNEQVHELAAYVGLRVNLRREFGHAHLPKDQVVLTRRQWDRVIERVHFKLICIVLVAMREENNLWYMDGDWCYSNLLRVEHDRIARMIRDAQNTYHGDRRNWHGRPAQQGRRRAREGRVAPGVSIGGN